jgi:hypothetical protein
MLHFQISCGITVFLTVREGLTGPEEAPFAGTPRQNCQKLWLLGISRQPVLLCSHVILAQFLTIKKRSQRWLNVESEPLSTGAIMYIAEAPGGRYLDCKPGF